MGQNNYVNNYSNENREDPMKKVSVLGIDLAKNVFQFHGVDDKGKVVLRKKLTRAQVIPFMANLPPCLVGMEACGGSNHWAREFQKFGHNARLMSPQFVKPYVKSNKKNDASDAEAICEAVSRPNMRFVSIKQVDQQDIQNLHRIRERLVKGKTALANEIRSLLHEYGIIIPKGISNIKGKLLNILADEENKLTSLARECFQNLLTEFCEQEEKLKFYNDKLLALHNSHPISQRLSTIPGVGPITATAILTAVGDPKVFNNGREFAAWLGLVPRQNSSGGKTVLLGISKRGDTYIRKLLVHGARSTLRWLEDKNDKLSTWLKKLIERRGINKASVALANKNARIIWALMTRGEDFKRMVA